MQMPTEVVFPVITAYYLAPIAIIFAMLTIVVVGFRAKYDVAFGDGGNDALMRASRAHGNFVEYVPLIVILIGANEALGQSATSVHWLMGTLFLARIAHPIAFFSRLKSIHYYVLRGFGAFATLVILLIGAISLWQKLI